MVLPKLSLERKNKFSQGKGEIEKSTILLEHFNTPVSGVQVVADEKSARSKNI